MLSTSYSLSYYLYFAQNISSQTSKRNNIILPHNNCILRLHSDEQPLHVPPRNFPPSTETSQTSPERAHPIKESHLKKQGIPPAAAMQNYTLGLHNTPPPCRSSEEGKSIAAHKSCSASMRRAAIHHKWIWAENFFTPAVNQAA